MTYVFSKLFGVLINPLLWIFCVLLWSIFCKRREFSRKLIITLLISLFVFSNTFLIKLVCHVYEAKYPKLAKYDVGIVLGGFSNVNPRNNKIEFNGSGDRLFQAIALYKRGVIKKILIASGNANLLDNNAKEADLAVAYLKEIGIPDSAILSDNKSRNTVENAKNSAALVKLTFSNPSVLIITSAWHIPRASLIFNKAFGKELTYYPTNFMGEVSFNADDLLIPSAAALNTWPMLFKEWIGLGVDRFRV